MTTIHRFEQSHAWEQQQAGFLGQLWGAWWPGAARSPVRSLDLQRAGVDAVVTGAVASGASYSVVVEEKVRDRDYGDVLLEVVSNDQHGSPGWAVKGSQARLLLYGIRSTGRGWVFPMAAVQRAAQRHEQEWRGRFGVKVARNQGYNSINVPVPLGVFLHAIDDEHGLVCCPACRMLCEWSDLRGPSWCSLCRPEGSFEVKL